MKGNKLDKGNAYPGRVTRLQAGIKTRVTQAPGPRELPGNGCPTSWPNSTGPALRPIADSDGDYDGD